MASSTPQLLFRAWSTDSHGLNSPTRFTPASGNDQTPGSIDDCGGNLHNALLWKHNTQNPFVFFSSSLLFVLQFAGKMKSEGKSNISITCINTKTAITGSGSAVVFYTVNDLLKRFGIQIKNRSDDSKRQYNHEYAALTSVYPKAGSRFIPFESLVGNGLFDLYPQLEDVNQRRNVRLHLAVTDLRNFDFSAERALSREQIDVAARLVFSFMSCADTHSTEINEKIEMHMLAWFLALRKRKRRDASLEAWLDAHAHIALEKTANTPDHPSAHLEDVEISQYKELASYLANRTLLGGRVSDSTRIDHAIIARERAMWRAWRQASRDSHLAQRAERIARGDYPRQPRRSKNQSRSSRFMDDDYHHRERSRNLRRIQRPRDRMYR